VRRYRKSCGRAECPVCYEKWASKQAHRAEKRLSFYRGPFRKAIHVTANPSIEVVAKLSYRSLRTYAVKALKKAGLRGGCLIYHPWRELEDDAGRKTGEWYYSPHFHSVGFGWIHDTPEIAAVNGVVVKNHGLRKNVYATLMYQLSHAGVSMPLSRCGILPIAKSTGSKLHTVTWWGACSYNKMHVPREELEGKECCPICKAPLVTLMFVGNGDPPPDVEGDLFLPASDWEEILR
jgi:hypothetical protein